MRTDQKKTKGISQRSEITPLLIIVGQNFLRYFAGYLKFFRGVSFF
jgi:hypothetical protein